MITLEATHPKAAKSETVSLKSKSASEKDNAQASRCMKEEAMGMPFRLLYNLGRLAPTQERMYII